MKYIDTTYYTVTVGEGNVFVLKGLIAIDPDQPFALVKRFMSLVKQG